MYSKKKPVMHNNCYTNVVESFLLTFNFTAAEPIHPIALVSIATSNI